MHKVLVLDTLRIGVQGSVEQLFHLLRGKGLTLNSKNITYLLSHSVNVSHLFHKVFPHVLGCDFSLPFWVQHLERLVKLVYWRWLKTARKYTIIAV